MFAKLKSITTKNLAAIVDMEASDLDKLITIPKTYDHGHLAIPTFSWAKKFKNSPIEVAKLLCAKINDQKLASFSKVEAVKGYINIHFEDEFVQNLLADSTLNQEHLGHSSHGKGQKIVIDFASPNVAKPMHVGHLRATVIGQAICNMARTQGYDVVGLNHLGDWGVQFGKLAWAYKQWSSEYPFDNEPFESLYKIYVRFHEESEKNPELDSLGSLEFKKLENGDAEIKELWEKFVAITMAENDRLFNLMGVKHDLVKGESFYNDMLGGVVDELQNSNLLVESQGAQVVMLEEDNMPPCLIRKSDGASLYATRDLASALYRYDELQADKNVYVVGVDQSLHFKQVFKVLEKMGKPWHESCSHVSFGLYQFKNQGKMSTRRGNAISLEDIISHAIKSVEKTIGEKNPELADKKSIAEKVGVGAIVFNDLVNDRVKNVDFDWDKALSFDGDSGPYVQYTYVRCKSLIRKNGKPVNTAFSEILNEEAEKNLIKLLLRYDETLTTAFGHYKPHIIANYLLDVCKEFNQFYHKCRVISQDETLTTNRMVLVSSTANVLKAGLGVLNIQCPEAM